MRLLVIFLFAAACGGSQSTPASPGGGSGSGSAAADQKTVPGTPDQINAQIEKLKTYTAEMCQCEDAACAKRVNDEMAADAIMKPNYRVAGDQKDQLGKLEGRFNGCNDKAGGE